MPWRKPNPSQTELLHEVTVLSAKLLRANSELRTKTIFIERLQYLLRARTERIDELNGKLQDARAANQQLEQECEHLAALVQIS